MGITLNNYFDLLPKDVALEIFSYFDLVQLIRCSLVCKKFHQLTYENNFLWQVHLWQPIFGKFFKDMPKGSDRNLLKEFFSKRFIRTISQFYHEISEFVDGIELYQSKVFTCVFPPFCTEHLPPNRYLPEAKAYRTFIEIEYKIGATKRAYKNIEREEIIYCFAKQFLSASSTLYNMEFSTKNSKNQISCYSIIHRPIPFDLISETGEKPTQSQIEEFKRRAVIEPLIKKSISEKKKIIQERQQGLISRGISTRSVSRTTDPTNQLKRKREEKVVD